MNVAMTILPRALGRKEHRHDDADNAILHPAAVAEGRRNLSSFCPRARLADICEFSRSRHRKQENIRDLSSKFTCLEQRLSHLEKGFVSKFVHILKAVGGFFKCDEAPIECD
jgi:hypothetical protein